jgi:hypothetical protein
MQGFGFFEDNAIVRVARKWQRIAAEKVENACNARREATRVDPWIRTPRDRDSARGSD